MSRNPDPLLFPLSDGPRVNDILRYYGEIRDTTTESTHPCQMVKLRGGEKKRFHFGGWQKREDLINKAALKLQGSVINPFTLDYPSSRFLESPPPRWHSNLNIHAKQATVHPPAATFALMPQLSRGNFPIKSR